MNANRGNRGFRRGYTLIEVLIVVLILAILMAVALPLYVSAILESERKTCRSNMYAIASAEQAYKTRISTHTYTTNLSDLFPDLGAIPFCPDGGTFSVTISDGTGTANSGASVPVGGVIIHCSAPGHGVFAPGVDGQ
jgi:type IV pilus assembly protein PilA